MLRSSRILALPESHCSICVGPGCFLCILLLFLQELLTQTPNPSFLICIFILIVGPNNEILTVWSEHMHAQPGQMATNPDLPCSHSLIR